MDEEGEVGEMIITFDSGYPVEKLYSIIFFFVL